jgi:TPR repeat protein
VHGHEHACQGTWRLREGGSWHARILDDTRAAAGNSRAMANLGLPLEESDPERARAWYGRAAKSTSDD